MRKTKLLCLTLIFLLLACFVQDGQAAKKLWFKNIKSKTFTESISSAPGKTLAETQKCTTVISQ